MYEVVSESSWTVIFVIASVKEDEREGQGNASTSLLHQPAMLHRTVITHYFYKGAFELHVFFLCNGWQN
jgi:hypothetical protein